jgi:hypothetical protein
MWTPRTRSFLQVWQSQSWSKIYSLSRNRMFIFMLTKSHHWSPQAYQSSLLQHTSVLFFVIQHHCELLKSYGVCKRRIRMERALLARYDTISGQPKYSGCSTLTLVITFAQNKSSYYPAIFSYVSLRYYTFHWVTCINLYYTTNHN